MTLSIGRVSQDRYRVDAVLGQGGRGAVYRGTDASNQGPGDRALMSWLGKSASLDQALQAAAQGRQLVLAQ